MIRGISIFGRSGSAGIAGNLLPWLSEFSDGNGAGAVTTEKYQKMAFLWPLIYNAAF